MVIYFIRIIVCRNISANLLSTVLLEMTLKRFSLDYDMSDFGLSNKIRGRLHQASESVCVNAAMMLATQFSTRKLTAEGQRLVSEGSYILKCPLKSQVPMLRVSGGVGGGGGVWKPISNF